MASSKAVDPPPEICSRLAQTCPPFYEFLLSCGILVDLWFCCLDFFCCWTETLTSYHRLSCLCYSYCYLLLSGFFFPVSQIFPSFPSKEICDFVMLEQKFISKHSPCSTIPHRYLSSPFPPHVSSSFSCAFFCPLYPWTSPSSSSCFLSPPQYGLWTLCEIFNTSVDTTDPPDIIVRTAETNQLHEQTYL